MQPLSVKLLWRTVHGQQKLSDRDQFSLSMVMRSGVEHRGSIGNYSSTFENSNIYTAILVQQTASSAVIYSSCNKQRQIFVKAINPMCESTDGAREGFPCSTIQSYTSFALKAPSILPSQDLFILLFSWIINQEMIVSNCSIESKSVIPEHMLGSL